MAAAEREVKSDIKGIFDEYDAWSFMYVPSGYGKSGVPDYIACVPLTITQEMVGKQVGVFVGVEAKRLKKKATPLQEDCISEILAAKGIALVVAGRESEPGNTFIRFKEIMKRVFGRRESK